jgi:hypothetical protein
MAFALVLCFPGGRCSVQRLKKTVNLLLFCVTVVKLCWDGIDIAAFFLLKRKIPSSIYVSVSKSFRTTGGLERELQMVQLSATMCSCTAILWVSLLSFAAITICVASQRMFIVVLYFDIDSVRKLFDTPSYISRMVSSLRFSRLKILVLI